MMPMRASIVGAPRTARSKASIAVCHSVAECSAFGSLVMYSPASLSVTSSRGLPRGPRGWMMIGCSNLRDQLMSLGLASGPARGFLCLASRQKLDANLITVNTN